MKERYAVISTDNQTGYVLGIVRAFCATYNDAWAHARDLDASRKDTRKGCNAVVRRAKATVKIGESVGFFDNRLEVVWVNDSVEAAI